MTASIWAALLSILKVIARPIVDALIFLKGVSYGRLKSENDAMRERDDRVAKAKKAKEEADGDDKPDPYLRD